MEIKIAKFAGFCIGVKKAVEKALATVGADNRKHPIYSLGHLVHNSFVVETLKEKGVIIVDSIDEIHTGGTLIISAHGVPPQILEQAKIKNLAVIDTTCIQVNKVQELVKQLSDEGFFIIIIGDKNHPEVKGVKEWAGPKSVILSSTEEAENIDLPEKIGIVSQTTISKETFDTITAAINKREPRDIKIFNTICSATTARQKSAIALAQEVDIMIIIGDKKSANTTRLYELSKEIQPASYLVSEAVSISEDWFKNKKTVGITAGASTPAQVIDAVITKIKALQETT